MIRTVLICWEGEFRVESDGMKGTSSKEPAPERMIRLADAARKRGDSVRECGYLEAALKAEPDFAPARCRLATAQWREGDADGAVRILQEVVASNAPSSWRADALVILGSIEFGRTNWTEAFGYYSRVTALDIEDPGEREWMLAFAYDGMGAVKARQGNLAAAAEHYTTALRHAPNHAPSLADMAMCYAQMGRMASAVHAMTEALRLAPDQGDWWFDLAAMYREAGKPHLARSCYKRAVELGEEAGAEALADLPPETALQWYESGRESEIAGDGQDAAECFRRALALGDARAGPALERLGDAVESRTEAEPKEPDGSNGS